MEKKVRSRGDRSDCHSQYVFSLLLYLSSFFDIKYWWQIQLMLREHRTQCHVTYICPHLKQKIKVYSCLTRLGQNHFLFFIDEHWGKPSQQFSGQWGWPQVLRWCPLASWPWGFEGVPAGGNIFIHVTSKSIQVSFYLVLTEDCCEILFRCASFGTIWSKTWCGEASLEKRPWRPSWGTDGSVSSHSCRALWGPRTRCR